MERELRWKGVRDGPLALLKEMQEERIGDVKMHSGSIENIGQKKKAESTRGYERRQEIK